MPVLLQDRPSLDSFSSRRPRRRFPVKLVGARAPSSAGRPGRRLPVRRAAAGAVVAGAAVGINAVGDWIGSWGDPTEPRVIDRSPAPLLLALDDLSEYHAATATVRVDIDREIDTPWVPS